MKIIPVVRNISSNIKNTSIHISEAGRDGYSIGVRKSKIHKENNLKTIHTVSKSVSKKLQKNMTIDDLPIVAAAIGMLVPIPLFSPLMLITGETIKHTIKLIRKMH